MSKKDDSDDDSDVGKPVDFMPDETPGSWEKGTIESEPEEWRGIDGTHQTADVRDSDGVLHEDVTITKP